MVSRLPLVAIVMAVAMLVIQARVVIGGMTWDDVTYHTEIAPPRLAAAAAVRARELPGWWDGSGLGVPLAAEPSHGAAYPPTWLAATPRALDLLAILHVLWLALGVAAWARRLPRPAGETGALVAGILAATTGIVASCALRGALPALAHLPWIGWAASGLASASTRQARARAAVALGGLVAAVALAGQLALLADALALAGLLAARRWRWLVPACLAGLAIGAVQWVPAALAIGQGAGATVDALPLLRLVELVVPGSFGSATTGHGVADIAGAHAWAPSLFVGAPLLALAWIGGAERRMRVLLAVLAVLAVIAGHGDWPAWLGAPELHLAVIAMIAAVHAGAGADALVAGERRALRVLAIAAVLATLALAGVGGWRSSHGELAAALDPALVDGVLGIACMGAALVLALRASPRRAPILLVLIVAPSVGATHSVAPVTSRAQVTEAPPWARVAQALPEPRRMFRPAKLDHVDSTLEDQVATLAGTIGDRWGIAAVRSDDPARSPDSDSTWFAARQEGGELFARFGVGLAILPTSVAGRAALGEHGPWALARIDDVTPPAAVYSDWEWTESATKAQELLFPVGGGAKSRRGLVVLRGEGVPNEEGAAPPQACTIARWEPGAIDLRCASAADAYAVISSSADPGWCAQLDGHEVPWLTADVLRRAVALPPGAHELAWRYRPPGLALAGVLAALGIAALVALWVVGRRHAATDSRDAAA